MSNELQPRSNPNGDLTPKLRFPEFRSAPPWKEETLGEVATFYKGRGISKADVVTDGAHPCIRYGEIYTRYGEVIDAVWSRTNTPQSEQFLSRKNDVVIPASGETRIDIAKAACVRLDDVALGSDLNVIRSRHNGVFLSYLFNGPSRMEIAKRAQGDAVVHLYSSQLAQVKIVVPESDEQKKVADCLTSLDDLIAAEERKLGVLRRHKDGLVQRLFPREGMTTPDLRFPAFRATPEWQEAKAGEYFGNHIEGGAEGLPIYSVTTHDGLVRRSLMERSVDDIEDPERNRRVRKEDVVYNMMRMWQGAFGIAPEEGMVSPAYVVLQPRGGAESRFFGYLFKLPDSLRLLTSYSQGANKDRLRLYYKDFASIPFRAPKLDEQRRIANCLLTLDELISLEERKLNALRLQKKGLMQRLFPQSDGLEVRDEGSKA